MMSRPRIDSISRYDEFWGDNGTWAAGGANASVPASPLQGATDAHSEAVHLEDVQLPLPALEIGDVFSVMSALNSDSGGDVKRPRAGSFEFSSVASMDNTVPLDLKGLEDMSGGWAARMRRMSLGGLSDTGSIELKPMGGEPGDVPKDLMPLIAASLAPSGSGKGKEHGDMKPATRSSARSTMGTAADAKASLLSKASTRSAQRRLPDPVFSAGTASARAPVPKGRQTPKQRGNTIGGYTLDERRHRIDRFLEKRKRRVWSKRVSYHCRQKLADGRLRVKGRFVSRANAAPPARPVADKPKVRHSDSESSDSVF